MLHAWHDDALEFLKKGLQPASSSSAELDGDFFLVKLQTSILVVEDSKPEGLPQVADAEYQMLVALLLNLQRATQQKMRRRERLANDSWSGEEPQRRV